MSSLPADIVIWALLFIGAVFAGIGLMGLVIFPDTRSRMFTAFRATAIALGAIALAVLTYGFTLFAETGNSGYAALILRTLFLVLVLGLGTWTMYRIIHERTAWQRPQAAGNEPAGTKPATKDGE